MVIKLMKGLAQSAPPTCASMPASNRALWTTVNVHGAVSTLIATPTELSVKHLTPSLSIGVITLLDQQAARIEEVLAPQRQELLEQIQKEAADAGQALSAEELDRRVDTEFEKRVFATLGTSLLGRLSPDGTKLFFLRVVPHKNTETPFSLLTGLHTLYLIDLTTGEEPQVLSDETRWLPSFAFSPDGEQIIFESNRDGGRRLYLANSDGTKIRRLAVEGALNPCWY